MRFSVFVIFKFPAPFRYTGSLIGKYIKCSILTFAKTRPYKNCYIWHFEIIHSVNFNSIVRLQKPTICTHDINNNTAFYYSYVFRHNILCKTPGDGKIKYRDMLDYCNTELMYMSEVYFIE
jgi:hypothetical protein